MAGAWRSHRVILAIDTNVSEGSCHSAGAVNRVTGSIPQIAVNRFVGVVLPNIKKISGLHRWGKVISYLDLAVVLHGMIHTGRGGVNPRQISYGKIGHCAGDHCELSRCRRRSCLGSGRSVVCRMAMGIQMIAAPPERPVAHLVTDSRGAMHP